MDTQFLPQNSHLKDPDNFKKVDPDLCQLQSRQFIYQSPLLNKFPLAESGIYTLCGAHQTGKTTLLKSWIEKLLAAGTPPQAIAFFSGELIEDYHILQRLLQKQIANMPSDRNIVIILDEINAVRDWVKALKPLYASETLKHVTLMLSGSDLTIAKETQLPNTQSKHFHLFPLSFRETMLLKHGKIEDPNLLFKEFNNYLIHGGYFNAINDVAIHGNVTDKTLINYAEWIVKQAVARGRHEHFMREILASIVRHYDQQVTWNLLAQELTIDHPKTIGDYFSLLESLDTVFVQSALLEETLSPAPKKARKIMFTDPFIFHAIQTWLAANKTTSQTLVKQAMEDPESCSKLAKTCAVTQFRRYYTSYYIKAEGEIDLAYIHDNRFWPIAIAWISQIRAKDLKQILKYPNGRLLTKTERSGIIEHIRTEPLPLALWQLTEGHD